MADWPADVHPLNAADAERSKARVADIELGLSDPVDGWWWRAKAVDRIEALELDSSMFGLCPHEEIELAKLTALVAALRQQAGEGTR